MSFLINTAKLTSTSFKYQELSFKDYRTLVKCLLGEQINTDLLFTNLNEILLNCIVENNKQILNKLNYIDYIIFLLLLRCVSIGNEITLNLKNEKYKNFTFSIDLINNINFIQSIDWDELLAPTTFTSQSITVKYQLPTISNILLFTNQTEDFIYNSFIKEIQINKIIINFFDLSQNDQNNILQQLPAKHFGKIIKNIQNILKKLTELNFFTTVYDKEVFDVQLPLVPNIESISFIIKLIFNTDLETLYTNLFALINSSHFTGEYLDSCTPGEFYVYCKKLEHLLKEQNKNTSSSTLINSYGDNLPPIVGQETFGLE
jgi:hypothetical protein